jgi:hypothetical protein
LSLNCKKIRKALAGNCFEIELKQERTGPGLVCKVKKTKPTGMVSRGTYFFRVRTPQKMLKLYLKAAEWTLSFRRRSVKDGKWSAWFRCWLDALKREHAFWCFNKGLNNLELMSQLSLELAQTVEVAVVQMAF